MFESLDEQMKLDDAKQVSPTERWTKWALVALVSILIFAGLFFAVHFMEGK